MNARRETGVLPGLECGNSLNIQLLVLKSFASCLALLPFSKYHMKRPRTSDPFLETFDLDLIISSCPSDQ